jgi:hypothetical protein
LKTKEGMVVSKHLAPFLLPGQSPNTPKWSVASVASRRYYPVSLTLDASAGGGGSNQMMVMFVKKRSGHLTYVQDPHEFKSLLVQVGTVGSAVSVADLVKSFTDDPTLLAFAEFYCTSPLMSNQIQHMRRPTNGHQPQSFQTTEEQYTNLLLECLTQEKPDVLFVLFGFLELLLQISSEQPDGGEGALATSTSRTCTRRNVNSLDVWNVRLLQAQMTVNKRKRSSGTETNTNIDEHQQPAPSFIVTESFAAFLCETMDQYFASRGNDGTTILEYVNQCREEAQAQTSIMTSVRNDNARAASASTRARQNNDLGSLLVWHRVPFPVER